MWPLRYNASIELLELRQLDDLSEIIGMIGIFSLQWNDPCMIEIFKSSGSSHHTYLDPKYFWHPQILQTNAGYMALDNADVFKTPAVIFADSVRKEILSEFRTRCDFNLTFFPFDMAVCKFSFEMDLTNDTVTFANVNLYHPENLTDLASISMVWEVTNVQAGDFGNCYLMADRNRHCSSGVQVEIVLKRRWMSYILSIFVPSTVLLILMCSTLAMSPNLPDRPVFAVTIILALAILQISIKEVIPETAETILVILYININICLGTIVAVYTSIMVGVAEHMHYPTISSLEVHPPPSSNNDMSGIAEIGSLRNHDSLSHDFPIRTRENEITRTMNRNQRTLRMCRAIDCLAFSAFIILLAVEHGYIWSLLR